MRTRDLIEGVLNRASVFKSKEKLYPEYVPPELPHRERQLKELALLFRPLLTEPGQISQRVLLVGGIGTGKTVTARAFGREFSSLARSRGINLEYIHVNCHRDRTLYMVVSSIAKQVGMPIPTRGLSAQEIYLGLLEYLEDENKYVIIALDEFDYFIDFAGSDAVYFLVRTYDEYPEYTKRLNFIFIARNTISLSKLDPATESYLLRNIIRFEPYTAKELYDILDSRRNLAFYEGTVSDEILNYIAEIEGRDTGGKGNARVAIEILLLAGEAADSEGAPRVTLEHVRKAHVMVNPEIAILYDTLVYLQLHEILFLLAAVRVLRRKQQPYVRIGEVEEEYRSICEEVGEKPRRHTQVYEYAMNLKKLGLIEAKTSGKGYRGKSTLIGINAGPLEFLELKIIDILGRKLGEKIVKGENNVDRTSILK